MANPQLENGYIAIANELGEALSRVNLSAYESRVLWCIFRNTYGWNKKSDRISYTQFQKATGITRRHLGRTIKSLIARQIITCSSASPQLEYSIQKDFEKWQKPLPKEVILPLPKKVTDSLASTITPIGNSEPCDSYYLFRANLSPKEVIAPLPKEVTKLLPKEVNTKAINHILKPIYKNKREKVVLPEWINTEVWDAFLEMRGKIKKPLTERGIGMIVKRLEQFKDNGDDPNLVLEQSVISSWAGVFSLKGGNNGAAIRNTQKGYSAEELQRGSGVGQYGDRVV